MCVCFCLFVCLLTFGWKGWSTSDVNRTDFFFPALLVFSCCFFSSSSDLYLEFQVSLLTGL